MTPQTRTAIFYQAGAINPPPQRLTVARADLLIDALIDALIEEMINPMIDSLNL